MARATPLTFAPGVSPTANSGSRPRERADIEDLPPGWTPIASSPVTGAKRVVGEASLLLHRP